MAEPADTSGTLVHEISVGPCEWVRVSRSHWRCNHGVNTSVHPVGYCDDDRCRGDR